MKFFRPQKFGAKLCINWYAFLVGFLTTLQLGGRNLGLLPWYLLSTNVAQATVWASWPSQGSPPSILPPVNYTDIRKSGKNTMKFSPQ